MPGLGLPLKEAGLKLVGRGTEFSVGPHKRPQSGGARGVWLVELKGRTSHHVRAGRVLVCPEARSWSATEGRKERKRNFFQSVGIHRGVGGLMR